MQRAHCGDVKIDVTIVECGRLWGRIQRDEYATQPGKGEPQRSFEAWYDFLFESDYRYGTNEKTKLDTVNRGFPPSTLSTRLKALVAQGFVETSLYQEHPPRFSYGPTAKGRALGPVVQAMYD